MQVHRSCRHACPPSSANRFAQLTAQLAGRPLDAELDDWLNREHGAGSPTYERCTASCRIGVAEGWLCDREGGGMRYGRIFKPAHDLHGFSVDVVDMEDIAGPHHMHPNGEIDLVMPIDGRGPLRRPPGRLAGLPAGQRAPADGVERPRAGALPAAAGPHSLHAVSQIP